MIASILLLILALLLIVFTYFYNKLLVRCLLAEEKLKSQGESKDIFEKLSYDNYLKTQSLLLQQTTENEEKKQQLLLEMIDKIKQQLFQLENERKLDQGILKQQLTSMISAEKELRDETAQLAKALHSPKGKGRWGELQLKRVVELAGMIEHCDFSQQVSLQTEEGRKQPDVVIHLPGSRTIIVDAKVPLDAYLQSLVQGDEKTKHDQLKHHAKQLKEHILNLSRKNYWSHLPATPEFVVLFLPSESIFSAALEEDPLLMEVAAQYHIVLATPMTLIALLKAAAYGWKQENLSIYAENIRQLSQQLYEKIVDLYDSWNMVGKSLQAATKSFNKATKLLDQKVLKLVRKFPKLGAIKDDKELKEISCLDEDVVLLNPLETED